MTKMLMLLIMEDHNSRSEMDQNSDNRTIARAKEVPKAIKEENMVRNHVVTVGPTIHLISASIWKRLLSVQEKRKFQCLLLIQQEQPTAWSYTIKRT